MDVMEVVLFLFMISSSLLALCAVYLICAYRTGGQYRNEAYIKTSDGHLGPSVAIAIVL